MAVRRAELSSESACGLLLPPWSAADLDSSSALQSGQRLANPGLSGFSSNSSEQMLQILIGNAIGCLFDFT